MEAKHIPFRYSKRPLMLMVMLAMFAPCIHTVPATAQFKIGVAGVTHGHVGWILRSADRTDIELVGVAERDTAYALGLLQRYGIDPTVLYRDLDHMLGEAQPDAVCAFGNIYDHLSVVEACAPKGIHVMVEKPLAVHMEHAARMKKLADTHGIHVLTNYETTWYPSNHEAYARINDQNALGTIRKIVVHDGHRGPMEIGVSTHFLQWLTDPVLNGGGAIVDFGCYGANLATWIMQGTLPTSVTAVTQQIKPDIYPHVDDEATIILTYPSAQAIIQASWNWPISRKDMEVYGTDGQVLAADKYTLEINMRGSEDDKTMQLRDREPPFDDPFSYLIAVVGGAADPAGSLSSLEINLKVVQILDAARVSAKSGKTVRITD